MKINLTKIPGITLLIAMYIEVIIDQLKCPLRNVELIKQGPLCSRSPDDQAGPLYVVKSIEGQV